MGYTPDVGEVVTVPNIPSEGESTKCICPLCEKKHFRLLNWTGRGTPRKYCEACRNTKKVLRANEGSDVLLAGNNSIGGQHWDPKKR